MLRHRTFAQINIKQILKGLSKIKIVQIEHQSEGEHWFGLHKWVTMTDGALAIFGWILLHRELRSICWTQVILSGFAKLAIEPESVLDLHSNFVLEILHRLHYIKVIVSFHIKPICAINHQCASVSFFHSRTLWETTWHRFMKPERAEQRNRLHYITLKRRKKRSVWLARSPYWLAVMGGG